MRCRDSALERRRLAKGVAVFRMRTSIGETPSRGHHAWADSRYSTVQAALRLQAVFGPILPWRDDPLVPGFPVLKSRQERAAASNSCDPSM